MRRVHLKIKIINLSDEARTIRRFERRALERARKQAQYRIDVGEDEVVDSGFNPEYNSLHSHRVGRLRWAARDNHLAYGFLRGTPYRRIEQTTRCVPVWRDVEKIARRFYAGKSFNEEWGAWLDRANEHLAGNLLAAA